MAGVSVFLKKLFVPDYNPNSEYEGRRSFSITNRAFEALREAYLGTFTHQGETDDKTIKGYGAAGGFSRFLIYLGFEKNLGVDEDNSPLVGVSSANESIKRRLADPLAWIMLIFTFPFTLVRTVTEFLPKLISNMSFVLAEACRRQFFDLLGLNEKGSLVKDDTSVGKRIGKALLAIFIMAPGMLIFYPLYLVSRLVWMFSRAFTAPIKSMRGGMLLGEALGGKGKLGKFFGGMFALISLAVTATLYTFLFPLAIKYIVVKGLSQIPQAASAAKHIIPTISQAAQGAQQSSHASWITQAGAFINAHMPYLSSAQTLTQFTPAANSLITGAAAGGLAGTAAFRGLLFNPVRSYEMSPQPDLYSHSQEEPIIPKDQQVESASYSEKNTHRPTFWPTPNIISAAIGSYYSDNRTGPLDSPSFFE